MVGGMVGVVVGGSPVVKDVVDTEKNIVEKPERHVSNNPISHLKSKH